MTNEYIAHIFLVLLQIRRDSLILFGLLAYSKSVRWVSTSVLIPVDGQLLTGTLCWEGFWSGVQVRPLLISNTWHRHYDDFQIIHKSFLFLSLKGGMYAPPLKGRLDLATCFWPTEGDAWTLLGGAQPPSAEETQAHGVLTNGLSWDTNSQHHWVQEEWESLEILPTTPAENMWRRNQLPCHTRPKLQICEWKKKVITFLLIYSCLHLEIWKVSVPYLRLLKNAKVMLTFLGYAQTDCFILSSNSANLSEK